MGVIKIKNKIILVNGKYIVKVAPRTPLISEQFFIKSYSNILPVEKILKENTENNFVIYNYIYGNRLDYENNCQMLILDVYDMINNYIIMENGRYGDILTPKKSWNDFLYSEFQGKKKYMSDKYLSKTHKVLNKLELMQTFCIIPKLIHGDLGSFNLVYLDNKIVGIIDPRTIIGDAIYDFIYFIFSDYNITKNIDFNELITFLYNHNENIRKVFCLMFILLYNRISIEEKHNTHNIDNFNAVWDNLESIEKRWNF